MKKQLKEYLRELIDEFQELSKEDQEKLAYWEFAAYESEIDFSNELNFDGKV